MAFMPFASVLIPLAAAISAPPTPADIREELAIARSLLSGLSITCMNEVRAFSEDPESREPRSTQRRSIFTWGENGKKRVESWYYGYEAPGQGPFMHGIAFFDGKDTFRIRERSERDTQPGMPVAVWSGLNTEFFPTHSIANYETIAFGGVQPLALDAVLADPQWIAVVAPEPEVVSGQSCWKVEVAREGRPDSVFTFWLGRDVGLMPVKSTFVVSRHPETGQTGLINGTIASDFEEVRPGLWLPRVVRMTDPDDPSPETWQQFTRTEVRTLEAGADLAPELARGALDMIDFRSGERYLLLDGERGPSTPIADAKKLERELNDLTTQGRVLAASTNTPSPKGLPVVALIGLTAGLGLAVGWGVWRLSRA